MADGAGRDTGNRGMSAEEVKKVMAVQWEEKEPYCMPHGYQYKLENVDNYLKEMDELLLEAGVPE